MVGQRVSRQDKGLPEFYKTTSALAQEIYIFKKFQNNRFVKEFDRRRLLLTFRVVTEGVGCAGVMPCCARWVSMADICSYFIYICTMREG